MKRKAEESLVHTGEKKPKTDEVQQPKTNISFQTRFLALRQSLMKRKHTEEERLERQKTMPQKQVKYVSLTRFFPLSVKPKVETIASVLERKTNEFRLRNASNLDENEVNLDTEDVHLEVEKRLQSVIDRRMREYCLRNGFCTDTNFPVLFYFQDKNFKKTNDKQVIDKNEMKKTNKEIKQEMDDETKEVLECKICKQLKSFSNFYPQSKDQPWNLNKRCKECLKSTQITKRNTDLQCRLKILVCSSRWHSKKRNHKQSKMDIGFLNKLWNKQDGKCAVSRRPMTVGGEWQVSLDRINNHIGYEFENVRLVCLEFNITDHSKRAMEQREQAHWSEKKFEEAKKLMLAPYSHNQKKLVQERIHSTKHKILKQTSTLRTIEPQSALDHERVDEIRKILCTKCKEMLSVSKFRNRKKSKSKAWHCLSAICILCEKKEQVEYGNSFKGRISRMASRIKCSSKNRKKLRQLRIEPNLKSSDLIEMYRSQQGRCYYSNIFMSIESHTDWVMTIERLDPLKGYTRDNCALVCLEFNGSRAQWSRDKVVEAFGIDPFLKE